jgi:hypothetical protein
MSQQTTIREHLINAILELAGDEFDGSYSLIKLARESEEELIHRIIDIAKYYKE